MAAGRWAAAYYIVGYAVECGLKACVVDFVEKNPGVIYEDKKYSNDAWTHDLNDLLRLCDLDVERDADANANQDLGQNWAVVRQWQEKSRYLQNSELQARKLNEAITNHPNGVMKWVRDHW